MDRIFKAQGKIISRKHVIANNDIFAVGYIENSLISDEDTVTYIRITYYDGYVKYMNLV